MVAAPVLQAPDTGRGLVLTYLAESGTHVNEGAVVAIIDNQKIVDHLDDVQDMLSQAAVPNCAGSRSKTSRRWRNCNKACGPPGPSGRRRNWTHERSP